MSIGERYFLVEVAGKGDPSEYQAYRVLYMEDQAGHKSVIDIFEADQLIDVVKFAVKKYHKEVGSIRLKDGTRFPLTYKTREATVKNIIYHCGFTGTPEDF